MNAVNDFSRNIDLIHKRQELFESGKRDPNALHCYRRIDRVDALRKNSIEYVETTIRTIAVVGALRTSHNSHSARLECSIRVFQPLYAIKSKVALGRPKQIKPAIFIPRHRCISSQQAQVQGYFVKFSNGWASLSSALLRL